MQRFILSTKRTQNQKKTKLEDSAGTPQENFDSNDFVAAIDEIEAGKVVEVIDFKESVEEVELADESFDSDNGEPKRRRGRPRMTEEQKAAKQAKIEAGKTRRFAVGEEPNRRSSENEN